MSQTAFINFSCYNLNPLALWNCHRLENHILKNHNLETSKASDIYEELCLIFKTHGGINLIAAFSKGFSCVKAEKKVRSGKYIPWRFRPISMCV